MVTKGTGEDPVRRLVEHVDLVTSKVDMLPVSPSRKPVGKLSQLTSLIDDALATTGFLLDSAEN